MKTKILLTCLLAAIFLGHANAEPETETKYLAFQIFTTYTPNSNDAHALSNGMNEPLVPGTAALRGYVEDIKQRIGAIGSQHARLAVMLGPLTFDQTDAEITQFIEKAFALALETDVAVGFHIDDSMFWRSRKDLWSDPKNVEALDWDGTPSSSRRLDWSKIPISAPPQMCFNSKAIQHEVQQRSAVIGKAIQAGVNRLEQLKRPELFAGVIAGWETMIGQDFDTGKHLGYRALLNRGFTREHPPQDIDLEREKVVQEFIDLWTKGLADAGVSPQKIYSHTAFHPHNDSDGKQGTTYSQQNNFAPPSVDFGEHHRPGFSTYPQPGLFDGLYAELAQHKQTGWASCEGTNLRLGAGPGQSGITMETYLSKIFNHGGTMVNLYSWGIGGEAMKSMSFRVVTEGEEALQAYRKLLTGTPLVEGETRQTLADLLPLKVHKIQAEFQAWMQKAGPEDKDKAIVLMQKMQQQVKGRDPQAVQQTADAILKLKGVSVGAAENESPQTPSSSSPTAPDQGTERLTGKIARIKELVQKWASTGRDPSVIAQMMNEKVKPLLDAGKYVEAEAALDRVLEQLTKDAKGTESTATPAQPTSSQPTSSQPASSQPALTQAASTQPVPEEVRRQLRHNVDSTFVVFRDKIQEDLKLTKEQEEKLEVVLPDAAQFLQKIQGLSPEERKKEIQDYRPKARASLEAVMKTTLSDEQRARVHQIVLQREGLRNGEIWQEMQITEEQKKQFIPLMQQTQIETQALMGQLHQGGNFKEIQAKVIKVRDDLESQLVGLLTDTQKAQWKAMLGKPMATADLFDL
jgi:hypothetical protein